MNKKIVSIACVAAMSASCFGVFADEALKMPFEGGSKDFIRTAGYFEFFAKYKVSAKTCVNGSVDFDPKEFETGDTITVTPKPDDGYVVDKVYCGETEITPDENGLYKFVGGYGNVEVSATFKAAPIVKKAVTVAATENGTATVDKAEAAEGETVTITIAPASGYRLKTIVAGGQILTRVNDTTYTFVMPAEDVEVKVEFEAIPATAYKVTVAEAENGTVTVDKAEAAEGETVTITVAPASGYQVKAVTAGEEAITKVNDTTYTFTMPAKNVEVKAEFEAVVAAEYNVTVAKATNGAVTVDKEKAAEKETVTITVTPDTDYLVCSVYAGDTFATKVDNTTYTFTMPAKNVEVKATFIKASKGINIDSSIKNGKVTVDNANPSKGDDVTITAAANTGYKIKAVYVDGKKVTLDKNNEYTFNYDNKPVSVTAEFEATDTEYSIELSVGDNGSAHLELDGKNLKDKVAKAGDVIRVVTEPNNNYTLNDVVVKKLSDNKKVNFSNGKFTMPESDVKVTVTFKKKSTGGGGGSSSSKVYLPGATSTSPDVTNTTINVNGDKVTATSGGVLLDASKTAKGFSVKYVDAKANDYVVVDASGNVVAKSVFDSTSKMLKTVGANGAYTVKQAVGGSFGDVSADSWFKQNVDFVTARGIMNGTAQSEFDPQGNVTRAMVVATLQRMEDKSYSKTATPFSDVSSDAWYAASVAWAYENGIVLGMTETEFAPEAPVTREQLAVILDKYMKYLSVQSTAADLSAFADNAETSSWATESVANAVGAGIIGGSDGKINARGNATRAEYAAMLSRCINKICE